MSKRQQRRRALRRHAHMAAASGGVAAIASLATGGVAQAANTFTVTNLNDSGAGSLRAAIAAVNADGGDTAAPGDSIVFASNLSGTLSLTTDELKVQRPAQVAGPGADRLTIHAAPNHRIFNFRNAAKVSDLTLTGGNVGSDVGGAIYGYYGVEADRIVAVGNRAFGAGAIEGSLGSLTINSSTIANNAASVGGGVAGGLPTEPVVINNSTITGNTAEVGAGVDAGGDTTVTGSTIAGNVPLRSSTGQLASTGHFNIVLDDSIVAGNGTNPDLELSSGATAQASFSLIRNPTGVTTDGTDITGRDPLLGPLAPNGGPTPTRAPQLNSPVLDKGKSFGLTTDQRGQPRPFALPTISSVPAGGDRSDMGAVELHTPKVTALNPPVGGKGIEVLVTGTGFTGATKVLFGKRPASIFRVLSDAEILATAPAHNGPANVRVITPLGESPVASADRFAYPTVKARHPRLHRRKLNTGIKLSCPAGGGKCQAAYTATAKTGKHKKLKLGKGKLRVKAGKNKTLTIKLSRKALRTLKLLGHLKIIVTLQVRDGISQPTTYRRAITLKAPRK